MTGDTKEPSEMKACLHCSSTDVRMEVQTWKHHNDIDEYFVECQDCDARGPSIGHQERFKTEAVVRAEAVAKWNLRPAIDTAVQGRDAELRKLITPRLRESAEELHRARFWVERGGSGSNFEVIKSCLKHATADFADAVQDVRALLAALSPEHTPTKRRPVTIIDVLNAELDAEEAAETPTPGDET